MLNLRCILVLTLLSAVAAILGPNGTTLVYKTDTYLEAYSKSRIDAEKAKQGVVIVTAKDGEKKITNRDDSFTGYDYTPPSDSFSSSPSSGYLPSYNPVKFSETTYNTPPHSYGPPANTYGPPAQTYGPPAHTYGPPAQNYGPPAQNYGPPAYKPAPVYGPPPSYGVPYSTGIGFLDKLSLKLDILTIAKLMLKFFIFKKIVTMIAVVCMLLIIPKLIHFKKPSISNNNYNEEEVEERGLGHQHLVELSSLQQLFQRAIQVYREQDEDCGVTCRMQRVLDDIYEFQPYYRLQTNQTDDSAA